MPNHQPRHGSRNERPTAAGALPRRRLLLGAAAGGLAVAGGFGLMGAAQGAGIYATLRQRWADILTGGPDLDPSNPAVGAALAGLETEVEGYLAKLVPFSDDRERVFTDLTLDVTQASAETTETMRRLRSMAIAWHTSGNRFHDSAELRDHTHDGLKTVRRKPLYREYKPWTNWWDREIGAMKPYADCLVLLHDVFTAEQLNWHVQAIQYFIEDPWYFLLGDARKLSTGANRLDLCWNVLLEGIAGNNPDRINRAVSGLPAVCAYVNEGDGFYGDGSFIQHVVHPYTGAYGTTVLNGLSQIAPLVHDTEWALDFDGPVGNIVTMVDRAFAPVIHNGRMMYFVKGREVSRPGHQEHGGGATAAYAILNLADTQPEATAERWRSMCRGWMERSAIDYTDTTNLQRVASFTALLDSGVAPAPERDRSVIFPNMARAVHHSRGWAFAIAMSSERIARYESINGENLKGWHTGSGMTYLYDGDSTQFTDEFWPTVDPYRLPGTTIDAGDLADAANQSEVTSYVWAGGATDGRCSVVGMTLDSAQNNVFGKKSWFCFDEYVVALGSRISGGAGNEVTTVVENRNLHADGGNALLLNGSGWLADQDSGEERTDARWAHIEGVGGYLFGPGQRLHGERYSRIGRWDDIGSSTSDDITRRYLSLVLRHGTQPEGVGYEYAVVPQATADRMRALAGQPGYEVLANDARAHAVRQARAGLTLINFWEPDTTAAGVYARDWCSVIVRELDGQLSIAIANPMRNDARVRVRVTPNQTDYQLDRKDSQIPVAEVDADGNIVLEVESRNVGSTYTATFQR